MNLETYSNEWVARNLLCDPAGPGCSTLECDKCSDGKLFLSKDHPDSSEVVSYQTWFRNDAGMVERLMVSRPVSEAFQTLVDILPNFQEHHLIKRHQAAQMKVHREAALNTNNKYLMLHFDFAENYSCTYQDAVQSAYWCQQQVTLFTLAVYSDSKSQMAAFVSDCLEHTKPAVITFLELMLKKYSSPGQTVILWSDGPASQFKNRYTAQAIRHLCDVFHLRHIFWNFSATSHGKGAVDGVGGTLKRTVWREVKARRFNVGTAEDFVRVIKTVGSEIDVELVKNDDIQRSYSLIQQFIENSPPFPGISATHFWRADAETDGVYMAKLSPTDLMSQTLEAETHSSGIEAGGPYPVTSWVAVDYLGQAYPGEVTATKPGYVLVNCMEHAGSSNFRWPAIRKDEIWYKFSEVLCSLAPPVPTTGRGHFKFHDLPK